MPYCKGCGKKEWPIFLTKSGYCQRCYDDLYASQSLSTCKQSFADRRMPENLQRIYDAFCKQYPDALVTGIVKYSDACLLIYLDGKPAYYATFDPLTATAKLRAYVTPSASTVSRGYYVASGVCAIVGLLFGVLLLNAFSFNSVFNSGVIGCIASIITLAGSIARSRLTVIIGSAFMLLPLVFSLYSAPYLVIMLICIVCAY